jgi:hypothetical protein
MWIVFDGLVQWPFSELLEDSVTGTTLPLRIGVVSEDRVLKLLLESVELCFGRLFRRHQSMTLWH